MSKMQELYEKVAADSALQAKFAEIMNDAEKEGEEATHEKLIAFAKEAGYEIQLEEMQSFFKELLESDKGELSDPELDMVAGGKSVAGSVNIVSSVMTFGFSCAFASLMTESVEQGSCGKIFR